MVVHAGETLTVMHAGGMSVLVELANRWCNSAGEMSVPMWNSRSYAMPNLDHAKFTVLWVGYHSHPSGSILARLRSVDNNSGG